MAEFPSYTDTGLNAETAYTYVVRMSDQSDGSVNVGSDSAAESATTQTAPASSSYTVQLDFNNVNTTPTAGGTWNELDTPADTSALLDSSGSTTTLAIASWTNFTTGSDGEATDYDYSVTEWGLSAQDSFEGNSAARASLVLSGFNADDTVEIRLIAVENNRRDLDFQVESSFGIVPLPQTATTSIPAVMVGPAEPLSSGPA